MQVTEEFVSAWAAAEAAGFNAIGPVGLRLPKQAWLARHHSGDLSYR